MSETCRRSQPGSAVWLTKCADGRQCAHRPAEHTDSRAERTATGSSAAQTVPAVQNGSADRAAEGQRAQTENLLGSVEKMGVLEGSKFSIGVKHCSLKAKELLE
ncbi:hypothetical protein Salat_2947600 [Sesamum alatum]|uniref:Uncharacterized protein n=1 Tax=Sesamum alatum TaxID=300844 RepID=A0AAE1XJR6_9LAMI|nr:hypothetical protein Salat_2947600 [Sesamum alatum]